jgi:proteasome lid subunit RPN8/RPN11
VAYGRSRVLHAYRRSALELAHRHARQYPRQEVGGILLGIIRESDEGQYLSIVTGIIRSDTAISREASLRFGPDTWVDTLAVRDRHPIYGDEDTWQVVGWYHTHPGFGIFLSSLDVHTHGAFLHPGHIALVIDPSIGAYGTFGWNHDQTQPVRLAEESGSAQWKTLLDDAQTLALLKQRGLALEELPTADPADTGPSSPRNVSGRDRE